MGLCRLLWHQWAPLNTYQLVAKPNFLGYWVPDDHGRHLASVDGRKSVIKASPRHCNIMNVATSLRELQLRRSAIQRMQPAKGRQMEALWIDNQRKKGWKILGSLMERRTIDKCKVNTHGKLGCECPNGYGRIVLGWRSVLQWFTMVAMWLHTHSMGQLALRSYGD